LSDEAGGLLSFYAARPKRFLSPDWEEKMKRKQEKSESENSTKEEVRMELKYCERCGGLWVRQTGTTEVYCQSCQRIVDELPVPKKKPQRIELPLGQRVLLERYADEEDEKRKKGNGSLDIRASRFGRAAGGVA
jgi:hypothetical protein